MVYPIPYLDIQMKVAFKSSPRQGNRRLSKLKFVRQFVTSK